MSLSGLTKVKCDKGLYTFHELLLVAQPEFISNLKVSTTAIDD